MDAENAPIDVHDAVAQLLNFKVPEIETPGMLMPEAREKLNTTWPLTAPNVPFR